MKPYKPPFWTPVIAFFIAMAILMGVFRLALYGWEQLTIFYGG